MSDITHAHATEIIFGEWTIRYRCLLCKKPLRRDSEARKRLEARLKEEA